MKDIKLKDGDIELDYVTGTDEIVQSGTLILSTRRGESDLVPELGMDRSSLFGKNFSKELAVSGVYEALEQDERFTNVTASASANYQDRSAKINLMATVSGGKQVEMEVGYA